MRVLIFALLALGATPTLEDRVSTLETDMAACCGTEYGLDVWEEREHGNYVALKRRVTELEERVKELEARPK